MAYFKTLNVGPVCGSNPRPPAQQTGVLPTECWWTKQGTIYSLQLLICTLKDNTVNFWLQTGFKSKLFLQANVTQIEVNIPHKHHNAVIGAKGRLIRSIMDECGGVSIKFPPEGSNSDKVLIRGPKDDVEKAKKQLLDLLNEKVWIRINYCE